jgi:catechol 2,3-dioxygenase-like lactoylglutathione lyase family enzyme
VSAWAVAPILPSRDLPATSAFYERLGFEEVGLWPDEYLIGHLYVEDVDSLHAEFSRLGLPHEGIPRLHGAPVDVDYNMREVALVDPDGNLLRVGSPVGR